MTTEKIFDEALKNILSEDEILKDEPMKHHTTFRVGGPAEYYLRPKKEQVAEVLRLCLTYQKEYLIIGNGSNLLVSDKGISGVVIEIGKQMDEITVDGTTIYAQAGAMLSKTAHAALEAGLTGMEFAAGIPGCVGGAVVMNAGAYGGEMKDILKSVTVLTADGQEKELTPGELDMSYRHSSITEEHYMVLGVTIAVPNDTTNEARALLLLQDNGLIKLKDGVGLEATVNDIAENPKGIEITELEAAQVPHAVDDAAFVVLNGNYALEAGYTVAKDALAYEKSDSEAAKTYVNIIAVKEGNEDNEGIKELVKVLKSDDIKKYINDTYDGAVIPFEE